MIVVKPSYKILTGINPIKHLQLIKKICRVCYKSKENIDQSIKKIIGDLLKFDHSTMIEHIFVLVKLICDSGVSHQLVCHKIASFFKEFTQYCNYYSDKFSNQINTIKQYFYKTDKKKYSIWRKVYEKAERACISLLFADSAPFETLDISTNFREWRNIFELWCAKDAYLHLRQLLISLLKKMKKSILLIFNNIEYIGI